MNRNDLSHYNFVGECKKWVSRDHRFGLLGGQRSVTFQECSIFGAFQINFGPFCCLFSPGVSPAADQNPMLFQIKQGFLHQPVQFFLFFF